MAKYGIYAHTERSYSHMVANTEWGLNYWINRLLTIDAVRYVEVIEFATNTHTKYYRKGVRN